MAASPEFTKFAEMALGTSDPARIDALKEAVMACMDTDEEGGYEDEAPAGGESSDMALIFGGKPKK